jgi:hypothetical protein
MDKKQAMISFGEITAFQWVKEVRMDEFTCLSKRLNELEMHHIHFNSLPRK